MTYFSAHTSHYNGSPESPDQPFSQFKSIKIPLSTVPDYIKFGSSSKIV